MYEQICNILKQNNIEYDDILWVDQDRGAVLNDGEIPIIEYLIGNDSLKRQNYVWVLLQNGEKQEEYGYTVLQEINFGGFNVLALKEAMKPPHSEGQQEEIEIKE